MEALIPVAAIFAILIWNIWLTCPYYCAPRTGKPPTQDRNPSR